MPPASQIQQQPDHAADDALHAGGMQQNSSQKADASQPADNAPRLNHPGTVMLPEQVVGSAHEFSVPFPYNLDQRGRPALVTATAMDDRFKLTTTDKTIPSVFGPAGKTPVNQSAGLVFTPKKPGMSVLIVQFNASWDDGHVEQLEVQVIANARDLDNKPAPGVPDEAQPDRVAVEDTREPTLDLFNSKVDELNLHLNDVARSQVAGVDVVDAEAAKYTEPTPAPPTWAMLAELAITIGTAGVAAIVGKYVATKIVGLASKEAAAAQTVAKDVGKTATKGAEHAGGHVATEVTHKTEHVVSDAAKHGAEHAGAPAAGHGGEGKHYAIEGLATGLEDAIKDSIKIKVPEHEEKEGKEGDEEGAEVVSKDPRIQFFHTQREALGDAQVGQGTDMIHILDGLRGFAKVVPGPAIKAVEAIQGGLEAGKKVGPKHQRDATATKWVDFVAQGKHGTAKAAGGKTVTKLDELHKQMPEDVHGSMWVNWLNTQAGKGVLEISVDVDDELNISVDGAQLDGVSRLIGDRLLKMDLRTAGIPIRLKVTNFGNRRLKEARDVITVDETGNVRTGGPRQYEKNTANEGEAKGEAQNIQGAQHIVNRVLTKTLSQWGISHVESDDKSK